MSIRAARLQHVRPAPCACAVPCTVALNNNARSHRRAGV